jgi:hypothetical protein
MASERPESTPNRLFSKRRPSEDAKAAKLHALLDKALAAGAPTIEVESVLADLLNMARRRVYDDELQAGAERSGP